MTPPNDNNSRPAADVVEFDPRRRANRTRASRRGCGGGGGGSGSDLQALVQALRANAATIARLADPVNERATQVMALDVMATVDYCQNRPPRPPGQKPGSPETVVEQLVDSVGSGLDTLEQLAAQVDNPDAQQLARDVATLVDTYRRRRPPTPDGAA